MVSFKDAVVVVQSLAINIIPGIHFANTRDGESSWQDCGYSSSEAHSNDGAHFSQHIFIKLISEVPCVDMARHL